MFGSSRSSDKENTHTSTQEPVLPQPPTSPRMFRCHSDNSQRTCCDINPNAVSSMKNITHRNSVLSTKEKMANLLQLNSTLVKEVSHLRNIQHSLSSNAENLKEELQTSNFDVMALRAEKQKLSQEVNKLKTTHSEMKETFEAEKSDTEGRLECVSLVVDNLQSMNGMLGEEAARLREDAERYATERHALLADLDKMVGERDFFQEFVESMRASKEEIHEQMQQALLQAEREKKELFERKETLLEENRKLETHNEDLRKEVEKLGTEKISASAEKDDLLSEKESLARELSEVQSRLQEVGSLLTAERQATASSRDVFNAEKKKKEELEGRCLRLQKDLQNVFEQSESERHVFECETRECNLRNKVLSEENDALKKAITGNQEIIQIAQQELMLSKDAAMKAEAEVKEKEEALSKLKRQMQNAAAKASNAEGEYQFTAKALQCKLDAALKALSEEESLARTKAGEIVSYKEKLDKSTQETSAMEGKLSAEKEKRKRLEGHIQTMKKDLATAENAAIQAQNKAKAAEKEAGITAEKCSRDASQQIGSLESKILAMIERQGDLEQHIRTKETSLRAAVQAGNEARGKLQGLKEELQRRGRNVEVNLEAVRVFMMEMQRNVMTGSESIASLVEDFDSLMDVQAEFSNKGKHYKRGRSRARQSSRPPNSVNAA